MQHDSGAVILKAEGLHKTFDSDPVFSELNINIQKGSRIGLIGINGAGKSTLLKVLSGEEEADKGIVQRARNVRVLYVEQNPAWVDKKVYEVVFAGSDERSSACRKYMMASMVVEGEDMDMGAFTEATDIMERVDAWNYQSDGLAIAENLKIDSKLMAEDVNNLSGGQRKRCALAAALLQAPDVLLLDEPTNHLDIDALDFLGDYLRVGGRNKDLTMLLVTHDRFFLEKTCDKIYELDRASLTEYPCAYNKYLELKAERLAAEDADAERARTKLRKERDWMRRQPQGRQAKSKAREQQYFKLEDRARRREQRGDLELTTDGNARLGKSVIDVCSATFSINGNRLLDNFSYGLQRGERVGIVGANGVGKSTFLRILTGEQALDSGRVLTGETVNIGYYEQTGLTLDDRQEKLSMLRFVQEAVEQAAPQENTEPTSSPRLQIVTTEQKGRRNKNKEATTSVRLEESPEESVKAVSEQDARKFLQRFQFPQRRWFDRVGSLSGGERRRLQLLRILAKRPNVLIFDEPSNDLDLATLATLEDYLTESFTGSLVVVSHDEFFMNKVTDHLLVFHGQGEVGDFQGSYSDYLVYHKSEAAQRSQDEAALRSIEREERATAQAQPVPSAASSVPKLSHSERKEYNKLEREIDKLTAKIADMDAQLSSSDSSQGYTVIAELAAQVDEARSLLEEKEARWMELAELA